MANDDTGPLQSAWAFLNIEDPLVAWLVYRGTLVSASTALENAISIWHSGYLREVATAGRSERYAREVAIEALRKAEFPEIPSRLSGFYCFPDPADAAKALAEWKPPHFGQDNLVEVGLDRDAIVSRHDATWISRQHAAADPTWMRSYLNGDLTDNPVAEIVVEGRAWVYGTELRKQAYEIIATTWPESLGLLELARVGALLDSDIGLIVAFPIAESGRIKIQYMLNMVDANDPQFLDRFSKFDGEKNTKDLNASAELVVPDLRDRSITIG